MSDAGEARTAHVLPRDLALYVIDALGPDRKDAVERHVFACEECAEALEREARVEAALEQVAWLANERASVRANGSVRAVTRSGTTSAGASGVMAPRGAGAAPLVGGTGRPGRHEAELRARLASGGRRSRWAGGVAGAFAAAAALVLAFASATARSEPSSVVGVAAQRGPGSHDAAGDMSGVFGGEVVPADSLDGG